MREAPGRCSKYCVAGRVREGPHPLLEIYDSLSRDKREFAPLEDGVVRMYVCGITPYDVGHLGHARLFVLFDTVRRYLEFGSYDVRHIQNITDVDDDMVRVSRELGVSIAELTDRNQQLYLHEMDSLNVLRPDSFPRGWSERLWACIRASVSASVMFSSWCWSAAYSCSPSAMRR